MNYRLHCSRCGKPFRGPIGKRNCFDCNKELEMEDKEQTAVAEAPEEIGDVLEDGNSPVEPPEHDPNYKQRVKTQEKLKRRKNRAPLDLGAAKERANKKRRESKAEKKRKDPARQELAELSARKQQLQAELVEIEVAINTALKKTAFQAADNVKRICFGQYDSTDFDCTDLCPLQVECEADKTGAVSPPEGLLVKTG